MKKVLLIDNYDSLTYNLVQYVQECGAEVTVRYNDDIPAHAEEYDAVIFSPGPGSVDDPAAVGDGLALFERVRGTVPVLGVCLGHQMIAKALGAEIEHVEPAHGTVSQLSVNQQSHLFRDMPEKIVVARYHSMVAKWKETPEGVDITAATDDEYGHLMAFEKPDEKLFGVQFHPESIGTPREVSMHILRNFLSHV